MRLQLKLRPAERTLLQYLYDHAAFGFTSQALAQATGIAMRTVRETCMRLVAWGYVTQGKVDRMFTFHISPQGIKKIQHDKEFGK